ncbi:hypothetical protein E2C00_08475 [Streptomyces sp. WAC05374]|uniref:hypothetical protein n=1 Tax=Streptomyces sp. WAC05374 TaxID=2487420 RepID=UPI000F8834A0|nr:hypothetical protein [Streptomyces sp. WAC05374]RST19340.1 hypothetical protein EF905_01775 [Streptomyces sp. WAC05374]TDF47666.1 hypothetical protein E2C02_30065 [Streptomyces sp. WAC05374]TDF48674.1 hypothetical protein E2B92_07385 [Streptomyces sp. WAC05374]TDF59076.1 hypothetical protein E2C00_08475 [Streptomyces sp. WAC05374]
MFNAGDKVLIVACEDDPRAVGKTGRVLDEVPPGPLTNGRWTVDRIGILIAPVLVHAHEIRKVSG